MVLIKYNELKGKIQFGNQTCNLSTSCLTGESLCRTYLDHLLFIIFTSIIVLENDWLRIHHFYGALENSLY